MRILICCIIIFSSLFQDLSAQKYFTRSGELSFFSEAPVENIEAHNKTATSVVDAETGRIEFAGLIKAFQFEKALMQEHFNENYMESSKFPKATFKGQITNMDDVDLSKAGTYTAKVSGTLTIHGVSREIQTTANMKAGKDGILATSEFDVKVADYGIEIPALVRDNIAKVVRVKVKANYQPLSGG